MLAIAPSVAGAEEPIAIEPPQRATPVDFASEIAPLLKANCVACHNESKVEGKLVLQSPETIRRGGESGPAVNPGKGEESLLLRIASHREEPHMPPADNQVGASALTPPQLGLLKRWIDEGAAGSAPLAKTAIEFSPLPPGFQPILDVALTADGRYAACNRGNRLFVYDLRAGTLAAELVDPEIDGERSPAAHRDLIRSLAFSPDGKLLASGGFRTVKLWRREDITERMRFRAAANPRAIAISRDGKLLAVAESGAAIQLWDLKAGKQLRRIVELPAPAAALAFSADGAKLYAACDAAVCVFNPADGAALASWKTAGPITALALLSDDDRVITGRADGTLQVWDANTSGNAADDGTAAEPLRQWQGHQKAITSLSAVVGSKSQFLSASEDQAACIWDAASGEAVQRFSHEGPVAAASVDSAGTLATTTGSNYARLFAVKDASRIADLKGDAAKQQQAEALRGQTELAKALAGYRKQDLQQAEQRAKRRGEDLKKTRETRDKAEAEREKKTKAAEQPRKDLAEAEAAERESSDALDKARAAVEELRKQVDAAASDSKAGAADGDEAQLLQKQLDEAKKADQQAEKTHQSAKRKLDEVTNRTRSAIQAADKAIEALDTATSQLEREEKLDQLAMAEVESIQQQLTEAEDEAKRAEAALKDADRQAAELPAITAAALSPDGRLAAIGGEAGLLQLNDAAGGAMLESIAGHEQRIARLAFLNDSRLLAIDDAGLVTIHDVARGWRLARTIGRIDDPGQLVDRVLALAFSPVGRLLATGGGLPARRGELKLWRVADGGLERSIDSPHADTVQAIAFLDGGKQLATGSADQTIKLFDVASGEYMRTLEGHTGHVLDLAVSADGKLLASASADRSVKLWETASGEQLETYTGNYYRIGPFRGAVTSVAFVGATEQIVCAAGDGTARLLRTGSDRDVRVYAAPRGFLQAVATMRDGSVIVAGGQDGTLHTWNGYNGREIKSFPPLEAKR